MTWLHFEFVIRRVDVSVAVRGSRVRRNLG